MATELVEPFSNYRLMPLKDPMEGKEHRTKLICILALSVKNNAFGCPMRINPHLTTRLLYHRQ